MALLIGTATDANTARAPLFSTKNLQLSGFEMSLVWLANQNETIAIGIQRRKSVTMISKVFLCKRWFSLILAPDSLPESFMKDKQEPTEVIFQQMKM